MKITNRFNLPESFVNAVSFDGKKNEKRLSVTDLISPPLIRQLKMQHWDELESDVSDMLWALLGRSVHSILEKGAPKESLPEQKLEVQKGGFTIVGVPDLYHDGVVSDIKVTSTWSFILGEKSEWTQQLQVYKWLFEQCGFPVKKLEINAILRDWVKSKTNGEDYPPIPFQIVDIPLWSKEKIDQYIEEKVALHTAPALECSPAEKWERPSKYALIKDGNKKATKLFDSKEEANLNYKEGYSVVFRPGVCIRCQDYCPVKTWCVYAVKTPQAME